jgi:hypothetical protein
VGTPVSFGRHAKSGAVIGFLIGLFALGMPALHFRGARINEIAQSSGGLFFIWTLWALGALGATGMILSVRAVPGVDPISEGVPLTRSLSGRGALGCRAASPRSGRADGTELLTHEARLVRRLGIERRNLLTKRR